MKSFAKRLEELHSKERLESPLQQKPLRMPESCRSQPKKCISAKREMDHFHRNFEDLQNTLKLFSREKLPADKPLQREESSKQKHQPLRLIERNTVAFTPTRTERKEWAKESPDSARFFKRTSPSMTKSVVLEKSSERKFEQQPTSNTEKRPEKQGAKHNTFSSRVGGLVATGDSLVKLGLPNIGNTCYINSTLQCLFHLPNFNRIFSSEDLEAHLVDRHRGAAVRYAQLYQKVKRGDAEDLSTFFLKRAVSKKCSLFLQWNQQDAHEFTQQLLDSLHEDLNRITAKPPYRALEADRKTRVLASLATEYWNYYRRRDDSHVTDFFGGQMLSSVVCNGCGFESLSFDNFLDIALPMPRGARSLQQLLESFLQIEQLGDPYLCSKCGLYNKCSRKLDIWRAPKILMIQLKRFKHGKLTNEKIKEKLRFPLQGLNLKQFMSLSSKPQDDSSAAAAQYDLVGVVSHIGGMEGGHYYAHCRDSQKRWFKLDDEQVLDVDRRQLGFEREGNEFAYILFYSRKDNK